MPPRAAKKSSGGAAASKRTAARTAKVSPKPEAAAEEVSVSVVEVKEEIKVEQVVDAKLKENKPLEPESEPNGSVDVGDEEDPKVVYEEEDKGERLELEDNEPEYEPEEDAAVDYDGKDMEDDVQEEGDGGEEEGDVGEGEEGNMVDEEMDDADEDPEGEEGYQNVEEGHDAEEEEHHDVVKERRKRKEFEVFVGGLDKDATEDDLKKVFSEVGEVTEVRLMMNPLTKKNKGFAFLRFSTVEQAKRAVSELKNPVVNGKQCGVAPSQDSDTLFLGNICKTWTKEHLKEKLKTYGIENIEDLILMEDITNEGMNRGFAFLEFSSRSEAMDAYRRLQRRDIMFGVDRSAKVAFADSFIEPDDEIMAQVKTVFVDGLSAAWDEDRVKEYVNKFGEIEKIELARNMPAAKRKDFGFVTFSTHDSAVACAEGINNADLGEGDNKVKVRARLSRPLQRGKHGARDDFRTGRGAPRGGRFSWGRPPPHRFPGRGSRTIFGRGAPAGGRGYRRPIGFRDRRPFMAVSDRVRRLPPPERFYDRRPSIPAFPKSSSKREYRHDELAPRSKAVAEYGSRIPTERRQSYRDDYPSHGTGYSVLPRSASRSADRRPYLDDGYGRKLERPPPTYREGRSREYDSISASKRPYSAIDDASRYADVSVRQSRARVDYGVSASSAQYDDAYGERIGRSHTGYGGSRSSLSGQDSHELYSSRQGISYGGGSVSGSDGGGLYPSSFSSSYLSRGSDVGGSSYSSLYSGRNLSSSGYMGGSGSGTYY